MAGGGPSHHSAKAWAERKARSLAGLLARTPRLERVELCVGPYEKDWPAPTKEVLGRALALLAGGSDRASAQSQQQQPPLPALKRLGLVVDEEARPLELYYPEDYDKTNALQAAILGLGGLLPGLSHLHINCRGTGRPVEDVAGVGNGDGRHEEALARAILRGWLPNLREVSVRTKDGGGGLVGAEAPLLALALRCAVQQRERRKKEEKESKGKKEEGGGGEQQQGAAPAADYYAAAGFDPSAPELEYEYRGWPSDDEEEEGEGDGNALPAHDGAYHRRARAEAYRRVLPLAAEEAEAAAEAAGGGVRPPTRNPNSRRNRHRPRCPRCAWTFTSCARTAPRPAATPSRCWHANSSRPPPAPP